MIDVREDDLTLEDIFHILKPLQDILKVFLRLGISLFCGFPIPKYRLTDVLLDPDAINIRIRKILFRVRIALICRFPIPIDCASGIFWSPQPERTHYTKSILSPREILICGLLKQNSGFRIVLYSIL